MPIVAALWFAAAADAQNATVRLISHGGSGTVIATGEGWSLILSCAHCFDSPQSRNKPVSLDAPHPAPKDHQKVGVTVLAVGDFRGADLALLKLSAGPLPYVSPVAPAGFQPKGQAVSIGYDEMKMPPQIRPADIVRTEGDRTMTRQRPWHGRSGGALLDKETGYLIGVVSAYSGPPNHQELWPGGNGIYVSHQSILRFLTQAQNGQQSPTPSDPFAPRSQRLEPSPFLQAPPRH